MEFLMVAYNLLETKAGYINTGTWSEKSIKEAKLFGSVVEIASSKDQNYRYIPRGYSVPSDLDYVHLTSNNTIFGTQFREFPHTKIPLVADMSSDIFSRELDFSRFDLIYAGAQKNAGPAGATIVIIREDLLQRSGDHLTAYLNYATHAAKDSMYNTPPVFAIYMMKLTVDWVKEQGGLAEMEKRALARSGALYDTIDRSDGWYRCPVDAASRSRMNVCFRLPTEELEAKFIAEALEANFSGLKGHRSVGGCRASMYNAMPVEGAQRLAEFMRVFKQKNA